MIVSATGAHKVGQQAVYIAGHIEKCPLSPWGRKSRRRNTLSRFLPPMANDDWEGAMPMHKAMKALATSSRPISASRVKTAAATALDNVKVRASQVT